ncbi:MAG: hypothetical protein PVS3B3_08670 [Ktedonobacteraceae bacterium]
MKLRSLYPVILVPLLAAILITMLLRTYAFPPTHAASSITSRVALPGLVNTAVSKSHLVAQVAGSQPITLAIGLGLRNQADLSAYLQQVTQPQSSLYHHYLNASSFSTLYGPLPASETMVIVFLRTQGFTITKTYAHHMMIDVRGTVAQAEKTFQIHLNRYQAADGHLFYSNDAAPSLPANIATLISSVTGLDSSIQYSRSPLKPGTASIKMGTGSQAPNGANASLTQLCPQPGSPSYPTSYTPTQIASAYNFMPLYNAHNLGEGQTVGLLELDGFSASDIATYTACFGGKNTLISTIPIDGYTGAAGPFASEVELDMEMVLGLAPHLASLRVYEASNATLTSYNDAWARIISDDTPVVSTSWVFCEQASGITSEIQQESLFFQAAAAQGQTILAASGDLGANGCYDAKTGTGVTPSADDPASQPFVTGVGGTTLHINFDNTYASERVWNDRAIGPHGNGASGGGLSHIWYMPRWQQGPGVANAYSTGYREVPDVAVNADPQTGYDVYCSVGGCAGGRGWQVIGGTSAGAPVWAAMIALANEASIKANGYLMGFLNPSLYSINHGSPGTSYATAFHDIVPQTGAINNNEYVGNNGTYPDGTMYDMATGLGSFDAYNLTQNLITLSKGSLPRTTATNTTWYFAEGRVGGNFQEFLTLENPDPIQTAQVQVQYLLETGTGPKITHSVRPQSRATVSVNDDLGHPYAGGPGYSLSMIVTSLNGVGVVAERPMYFSWHSINSGTDALGATTLGQDFYFADVEALRNYSSFITILNPPGGQNANVTVSYLAGGKQVGVVTLVVPTGQRGTTVPTPAVRTAAVHVHSDQPVVVERPTYFSTARSNISGPITGASTVVGAAAPGTDWLFAEGYTGSNFHEYLVLANFDPAITAHLTVKLEYSNGMVNPVTIKVLPQSQTFLDVNAASNAFTQSTAELSAEVVSDAPIVAQRIEYFRFNGNVPGGTDVIGEPGPAKTNYSFAEGYTTNGFSEFLTLQNPNATPENVAVTLYLANSISTQRIVNVGPQTRVTININSLVVPIAQGNVNAGYEVSLSVQAMSGTVVAERPIYFNYHNTSLGGSDVVGYTG